MLHRVPTFWSDSGSSGDVPKPSTTEDAGFSVVRSLVGHGVGRFDHEDPQVPNFVTSYAGPELREGVRARRHRSS